ncbi:major facilitator superfamily MFS_1 [Beutenbergia cavernae DSM 12333]|uniref:Major facilitator superfamily MFS_1 n=2 Tax=Beutenbergia TaxID=84756 RepID=C5BWD0_BEUC1|nr:major facilitator superfamily MFS_1 [Beutenbergia cavernae DSM 12333]
MNSLGWLQLLASLPRAVKVLLVARFVNRIGAFSMPFLAVLLVQEVEASTVLAGTVMAAFGVATIPSRLLGGVLAQRVATRHAVAVGLLGTAAAQGLIASASSVAMALVGAVLLGLFFEIYEPASQALIADTTPDALLPRTYGLFGATLACAGLAAGTIAALVGQIGLRWLFVVDAATATACAALVIGLMPRSTRSTAPSATRTRSAWGDRRLWSLMLTGTAFATVYLTVPMAMPLALIDAGHHPSVAGWLEALSALVVIAAQPLLSGRPAAARRMVVGYAAIAAGLATAAAAPTLAGYAAATLVMSVGDALLLGYSLTLVARIAPAGSTAAYFAAYGLTWGVALILGPPAMGYLIGIGPPTFWSACAIVMVCTGAATAVIVRRLARATTRGRGGVG